MVSLSEYVDRLRSVDTQAELAQYAVNYLKSSPGVLESYVSMQYQKSLNAWSLKAQITWPEGTPLWQMRFMEGAVNELPQRTLQFYAETTPEYITILPNRIRQNQVLIAWALFTELL